MNRYLADACALIDFHTGHSSFPVALRSLFQDDAPSIAVLATTVWEIAIKHRRGKLVDIRDPSFATLTDMLQAGGYLLLSLDHAAAEQAANLPLIHNDPFDRALVAMAQRTGRTVLTSDRMIARYGVPVRW